jgi:tetratricopeptide (TPR) repeat protein
VAVFAGGFELDAAEAVGTAGDVRREDVLYLLANLVEKSLAEFDQRRNRYHLLETVRQYALERLVEASEEPAARGRHLQFYVVLAERIVREIRGPLQHELVARIEAERDNVASAAAHARDTPNGGPAGLLLVHGYVPALVLKAPDLASRMAAVALAHPGAQADDIARCHALRVTGFGDLVGGRHDAALDRLTQSVAIARRHHDDAALAESLSRLGAIHRALGQVGAAHEAQLESLDLARKVGNKLQAADAHCSLGELISLDTGKLELAQSHYLDALACDTEDADLIGTIHFNLARNAITLGTTALAIRYLRDALVAFDGVVDYLNTQYRLWLCGGIAMLRSEPAFALRLFGAAEAHRERLRFAHLEPDRSQFEGWLAHTRAATAEAAARGAFAEGAALSEGAAVAEAMAWLDGLPSA